MKPKILSDIDQIQAAKLDMFVIAQAESSVFTDCYAWFKTQDQYQNVEMKPFIKYNGVFVTMCANPLGDDKYVILAWTK